MNIRRTLTHAEARSFYDWFGRRQDWQSFYEDRAVTALLAQLDLAAARRVIELGAGTGRLAARLLAEHLGPDARYLGLDVSRTMVDLARARLAPFAGRAEVRLVDGSFTPAATGEPDAGADRVIATYVFDLLSDADIAAALDEAHRLLARGGRLGLVSLTTGDDRLSRALCAAWTLAHRAHPALMGGCRPIVVADHLAPSRWRVLHRSIARAYGLRSEVLVATPLRPAA